MGGYDDAEKIWGAPKLNSYFIRYALHTHTVDALVGKFELPHRLKKFQHPFCHLF